MSTQREGTILLSTGFGRKSSPSEYREAEEDWVNEWIAWELGNL